MMSDDKNNRKCYEWWIIENHKNNERIIENDKNNDKNNIRW